MGILAADSVLHCFHALLNLAEAFHLLTVFPAFILRQLFLALKCRFAAADVFPVGHSDNGMAWPGLTHDLLQVYDNVGGIFNQSLIVGDKSTGFPQLLMKCSSHSSVSISISFEGSSRR